MTDDVKERVDIAVRDACGCGLTHEGQVVFCDDPRLIGANDPYGNPIYRERCDCREIGAAALSALRPGDEINGCVLVPKSAVSDLVRSITEVRPGEMWTAASFDNFKAFRAMLAAAEKE